MADKKLKANLEIDGSLIVKASPNGQGDFLTIGNTGLIQKRTPLEITQDLNLPTHIDVSNWNTAYSWGNHAGLYSLLNHTHNNLKTVNANWTNDVNNYLIGDNLLFTSSVSYQKANMFPSAWSANAILSIGTYVDEGFAGTQIGVASVESSLYIRHKMFGSWGGWAKFWTSENLTQVSINSWNNAVNWINNYSLPMASSSVLGGIKIGSGLSIDANGIVTATGATQINSDWNATTGVSQILNKPTSLSQFTNDSGFITSFTETDPTVPIHVKNITTTDINRWNDAYSWGNHALLGYLTSASLTGYATQTWVQSQGYLSSETSEWQNNSYNYSIANPLSLGSNGIDTKGGFASNTQVLAMDSIIADDVHTVIRYNVSDDNIELEIPPAENFIDREIVITNNVSTSSSTSGLILLIGDPVRLNSNANIESICGVSYAPFGAPFPNFWSSITIKSIKDNTANGASWYVIDKSR